MRFFTTILSMLMSVSIFAQSDINKMLPQLNDVLNSSSDKDELLVWVFFNDKGENTSSYFSNPESVVSEKSLKRRAKVLVAGNLISDMDLPVNSEYIEKVVSLGFEVKQKSKWFNGVSGYATKSEIGLILQLSSVKNLDIVHRFKSDYSIEKKLNDLPQGNLHFQPGGVNSLDYGQSFTQLDQINVPAVHDLGFSGQGVTICLMDAGVDNLAHEVFASMNIITMWDFVNGDPNVGDEDDMGQGWHGTNTLSAIGGFKEGQLIGPAFSSDYILAKTENHPDSETPLEEDNWIAALEWADSIGVDVTSTSLSYLTFDPPFTSYTWEDMDGNTARITIAADLAVGLGIVVVNSAGNARSHPTHNTLGAPADGDSVITVGAVTSSGVRSSFSSVGPTVDGRIKPDLMAMGSFVYLAKSSSPTAYGTSNGTSYSCPLLAGAAALLLSVDPTLTPMEVLNLLRQTASRSNNPDNLMGWGIINTLDAIELIPVLVELTLFSGSYVNGSVQLEWQTASETNNFGFEVQKRYDNTSYEKIGFVPGNGTTTNGMHYSFNDNDLFAGRIFYRLKQIDFDGGFAFSDEIFVEITPLSGYQLFQNYPNPFNPNTTIKYSVPLQSKIKIVLYDIIGNKISTLFDGIRQSGIHEINLIADNLSSGVYFVLMTGKNFSKSIKISLLK